MKLLNLVFKVSVVLIAITYFSKELLIPEISFQSNKDEYMKLTLACGFAMDSNWYIEQQSHSDLQKSSEIQLLDCHDYDKLRKKMLDAGISEYRLSEVGLVALELHQKTAEQLAAPHKFRER